MINNMNYYDHQQRPPVGVPPPQGNPAKDAYPPQGYAPQYVPQQPPPRQEPGFLVGCLAALCCCCLLDACF